VCWRCQNPIHPDEPWDLGHDDSGKRYMGPEHRRCNRSHGGKLRAAQLYGHREQTTRPRFGGLPDPDPENMVDRWSRHWSGGFNPRCPDCREFGEACDFALKWAAQDA
jgi:hypothetical protein